MVVQIRRNLITIGVIIAVFLGMGLFGTRYFSQEAVRERITNQKNYNLTEISDEVVVQFVFYPQWIPAPNAKDTKNVLHKKVLSKGDSRVYLQDVVRKGNEVYIHLVVETDYNFKQGSFLSVYKINDDGSITTVPARWRFFNFDGKRVIAFNRHYGQGWGPGDRVYYHVNMKYIDKFTMPVIVRYSGLHFYKYVRN